MPLIPKKELSLYRIICVVTGANKYYPPTDTDVLVIYASANDITANAQIGELDDQDENHLKYAYGLMLRKIIKRLPDAKIFACIPHNFYNSHNNADYPYKNNIGLTIQDYGV